MTPRQGGCRMLLAVISVLAGNWRPSLPTRLRLAAFFALVAIQRHVDIAPRLNDLDASAESAPAQGEPAPE